MAAKRLPADPVAAAMRLPGSARARKVRGKTVSGTRLRKLVCSAECGYPPMRCSRAAIAAGLPVCVCGELFWPWDLDDVELAHENGWLSDAQRASHPLIQEYEAQTSSIAHGQAWDGDGDTARLNDPTAGAYWRVQAAVHETNQASKLAAARRAAVSEPMPF